MLPLASFVVDGGRGGPGVAVSPSCTCSRIRPCPPGRIGQAGMGTELKTRQSVLLRLGMMLDCGPVVIEKPAFGRGAHSALGPAAEWLGATGKFRRTDLWNESDPQACTAGPNSAVMKSWLVIVRVTQNKALSVCLGSATGRGCRLLRVRWPSASQTTLATGRLGTTATRRGPSSE